MKKTIASLLSYRAASWRVFVLLALVLSVVFRTDVFAEQPASEPESVSGVDLDYAAKVGDRIVTTEEYNKAVAKLHTTNRVGEALSGGNVGFEKPDYRGFLEQLIERALVIGESEKLGLDKDGRFIEKIKLNELNVFLAKLKEDEVDGKVRVSQKDTERYYTDVVAKELKKTLAEQKEKDPTVDDTVKNFNELSLEDKKGVSTRLYILKKQEAEAAFLKNVRKKASVKIYKGVLKAFSVEDLGTWDSVVAKVEGSDISGRDLAAEMRMRRLSDGEKEAALEKLVMNKALDAVAIGKHYEKLPDIADRLKKYRDDSLIDEFKAKVVLPLVKISDADVTKYYNSNKELFRESDMLNLKGIIVASEADAKTVMAEIKKGANFSFLAENMSLDPISSKKGGDMGWVAANALPEEVLKHASKAKRGKILGPYKAGNHMFVIYEFREMKTGTYASLDNPDVKESIRVKLGRQSFKENYDTHVKRLRESVPVVINEKLLKRAVNVDKKD